MRELDRGGEIGFRLLEFAEARDDRIDFRALARQQPIAIHVARRLLGRKQRVELRQAGAQLVELGAKRELHGSNVRQSDRIGVGADRQSGSEVHFALRAEMHR